MLSITLKFNFLTHECVSLSTVLRESIVKLETNYNWLHAVTLGLAMPLN
jgi:hypothetical protein